MSDDAIGVLGVLVAIFVLLLPALVERWNRDR